MTVDKPTAATDKAKRTVEKALGDLDAVNDVVVRRTTRCPIRTTWRGCDST